MKKVTKKEEVIPEVCDNCECKKIDKLTITFGSEDLNKLVDKINEIIEKND